MSPALTRAVRWPAGGRGIILGGFNGVVSVDQCALGVTVTTRPCIDQGLGRGPAGRETGGTPPVLFVDRKGSVW